MMLQSGVLAVGAYLVINQQATAGVIIASSILSARALAPVDLAISHWRSFVGARQARERLNKLLVLLPELRKPTSLPKPQRGLTVDNVSAAPPDVQRAVVHEVTFSLKAGNGLGVIGPSASGKSSLARVLVGLWTPARGTVRLDGAALDQWVPDELGRHVGYLPQDVELIEGTVAENISRFDPDASSEAIIAAAKAAGVNELVLSFRKATTRRSASRARPCRPASSSVSRWHVRFMAIRFWSCSTSRIPILTSKATRR